MIMFRVVKLLPNYARTSLVMVNVIRHFDLVVEAKDFVKVNN